MKKLTLFSIGIIMVLMAAIGIMSGGVMAQPSETVPVSNGLRVIAAQSEMGICGIIRKNEKNSDLGG